MLFLVPNTTPIGTFTCSLHSACKPQHRLKGRYKRCKPWAENGER